jgi:hypothetical protein
MSDNTSRATQGAPGLYEARLRTIFKRPLEETYISLSWREYLKLYDGGEWIVLVSQHTPPHVKEILGREEAPSWEGLLGIDWTETIDAGMCDCWQ